MLLTFLKDHYTTLSLSDLIIAIESKSTCISIKDVHRKYHFANQNFVHLMGKHDASEVLLKQDVNLTNNKELLSTIKQHDESIIEEGTSLNVSEEIHPVGAPYLAKRVEGLIHPVYFNDERLPRYILGVFTPSTRLLHLDYDTIFKMSLQELSALIPKQKALINYQGMLFKLAKREIEVIIGMIRGLHAGEIAQAFNLKQTTIESYVQNIKNKLGVGLKSELIRVVLENNLLEQVLL